MEKNFDTHDEDDFSWEQRVTMLEIKNKGFDLINVIHSSLVKAIISDIQILNGQDPSDESKVKMTGLRSEQPA